MAFRTSSWSPYNAMPDLESEDQKAARLAGDRLSVLFAQLRREFDAAIHKLDSLGTSKNSRDLAHLRDEFESLKAGYEIEESTAIATAKEAKHTVERFEDEFREGMKIVNAKAMELSGAEARLFQKEADRIEQGDRVLEGSVKVCGEAATYSVNARKWAKFVVVAGGILLFLFSAGLIADHFVSRAAAIPMTQKDIQKIIRDANIDLIRQMAKEGIIKP